MITSARQSTVPTLPGGSESAAPRTSPRSTRPLIGGDFRCVAQNGWGDGNNSYAYSSAWFNDHLYIGSNRHILPLLILRLPFEANFAKPPVPTPPDYTSLDLRGQIWRYCPATNVWERVYHAPLVPGYGGRLVPQAFGFRGMTVFQGKSDPQPAIYTFPFVGRNVLESSAFCSRDGLNFEALPPPIIKGFPTIFGSFRSMVSFKGRLFVAPSSGKPDPKAQRVVDGKEVHVTLANTARQAAVLCSDDPASGEWQLSSDMVFGDRTNTALMDMTVCGDYLYCGATNLLNGFQLWRTRGEGPPPHHWEKVLDRGGERGCYSQAALSMAEFRGSLYIGTCVQNGGYDQHYNIGPAASELLRFHPDGSWDIVVGDPRMTSQGFKTPTSGMRPGFNNPLAGYFWRTAVHEDAIYVGTCDLSSFVPFSNAKTWPEHARRLLSAESLERYMEYLGGCELWRSSDGDNWTPITRNGFNNRFNLGIRSLVSTPHGLFVGTANPFGSHVAVRGPSGWRYEENPRGGVEVWLGSTNHPPLASTATTDRLTLGDRHVRPSESIEPPPQSPKDYWRHEYPSVYVFDERAQAKRRGGLDPFVGLATAPNDLVGLAESVTDELNAYFNGSLRNVGYWRNSLAAPHGAAQELLTELLELAPPEALRAESLRVVSLATGSETAKRAIRERSPGATLNAIEPTALPSLAKECCDLLLAIERPLELNSATLKQFARVLKPRGVALLAHGFAIDDAQTTEASDNPARIAALNNALLGAGFDSARIEDITAKSWTPFFNHSRNYFFSKLLFKQLDAEAHGAIVASLPGGKTGMHGYVLVCAIKR